MAKKGKTKGKTKGKNRQKKKAKKKNLTSPTSIQVDDAALHCAAIAFPALWNTCTWPSDLPLVACRSSHFGSAAISPALGPCRKR